MDMMPEYGLTDAEAEIAAMGSRLFAAINWRDDIRAMRNADATELRQAQVAVAAFRTEFRQALRAAAGELIAQG